MTTAPASGKRSTEKARVWVAYLRVSTEEQATEGVSLGAQRESCIAMLKAGGITNAEIVEDAGFSAKSLARPGIRGVLERIDRGEIAGVCVYRLDRLTRNLRDLLDLVDRFARADAGMRSVSEMLDTTSPMGRFTLSLLGAIAQWERETIAERVTHGMRHRIAQGGYIGGPVPAGTRVIGTPGKRLLEVDPRWRDEAAIAWRLAAEGVPLSKIAATLTDNGLPPPKSGKRSSGRWHKGNLHAWLTNERLVGLLVDRATFDRAQANLASRANPKRQRGARATASPRTWPLQGIARCAKCGAAMIGVNARSRNGSIHYYLKCSAKNKSRVACSARDIPAEQAERVVADLLVREITQSPAIERQMSQRMEALGRELVPMNDRRAALVLQCDGAREQVRRVVNLVADGGIVADAARSRLAELQSVVVALDTQIAGIDGAIAGTRITQTQVALAVAALQTHVAGLATATPEARAEAFRALIREVRLDRDSDTIEMDLMVRVGSCEGDEWRSLSDRARTDVHIVRLSGHLIEVREGRRHAVRLTLAPPPAAS